MWRRRLEVAFEPDGGFVDYRDAPTWVAGIEDVLDGLDELVEAGHAGVVVTLVEHAHRLADGALQYVDDSDGWITNISAHLGETHLRACEAASPDPVELARRLADLELSSELDTFHRAAAVYAEVLGADGLAEYRRAVEPRWRKSAPKGDQWSTERFRLREAMTGIALATHDPDEHGSNSTTSRAPTTIARSPSRFAPPAGATPTARSTPSGGRSRPTLRSTLTVAC